MQNTYSKGDVGILQHAKKYVSKASMCHGNEVKIRGSYCTVLATAQEKIRKPWPCPWRSEFSIHSLIHSGSIVCEPSGHAQQIHLKPLMNPISHTPIAIAEKSQRKESSEH